MRAHRVVVNAQTLIHLGVGCYETCRKELKRIKNKRKVKYVTAKHVEEELGIDEDSVLKVLNPPKA